MSSVIKGNTFKSVVLFLVSIMLFAVISPDLAKASSTEVIPEENNPVPIEKVMPNPEDLLKPIDEDTSEIQDLGVVTAVVALMVGAIALGKGWHGAGYWAAKQMHKKKGLSTALYFGYFRTYIKIKLIVMFGPIAWNGFDDYYYDQR